MRNYRKIYTRPESVNFVIYKFDDLFNINIPLYKKNCLIGTKWLDFEDFCRVANTMKKKQHLSEEGVSMIRQIKLGMNT